ncbi:MAG: lytic transglycosylase domain-containing protein [Bdellovibrionales bacterium]|nr:lytic transglycosylase domain-containing protein [Bdellovibrionales bacterium]
MKIKISFLIYEVFFTFSVLAGSNFSVLTPSSPEDFGNLFSSEDAPVLVEPARESAHPLTGDQFSNWKPPDFSDQEKSLGYSPEAFSVPKGMEERVAFWIDIYTKLTTDQGWLHDSKYVHLVYEMVDFSDLNQNSVLSLRQLERKRKERIKLAKKNIQNRLFYLSKQSSDQGLAGDDLRYWRMFSSIDEPQKFIQASLRGRLRFQLGQRDRFIDGIFQSGRYLKEMEEIFKREGLPLELTRLPFVESSFNLKARSKVGASGIWQFMRTTARAYLRMDASADERNDPLRSTVAAAKKLRNNFEMLQNWPLAVTGYNHGPSGVQRLVKKYQTTQLAELTDIRKNRFGFASANFYASFLAAIAVEREAEKYFGPLPRMLELRGVEVRLDKNLKVDQLIKWFDGDQEKARLYNPHLRLSVWPHGVILVKNFIRILPEKFSIVSEELKNLKLVLQDNHSSK